MGDDDEMHSVSRLLDAIAIVKLLILFFKIISFILIN